jgi:hypothetical protein
MIKRVALGVMLLMLCSPAVVRAELTVDERADIKDLIESMKALRAGERYLTAAIVCCSTPDARPALATALGRFHTAQIAHWLALGNFLHTGTENPTPKPTLSTLAWHTTAWFYLNRYEIHLVEIQADLKAAQAFHKTNAAYQDNLRRARDIWVASARGYADRLDPALMYNNPWPALAPGKTIENVVGPHGDYRMMHFLLNRGKNYAMDTYGALITVYRQGGDAAKIREAWTQSSEMLDALDKATGLLADVTFTAEEAAEDRFCRVLRATKMLTVTAALRYQTWGDIISQFLPAPYNLIVAKLVDSWKHAVDLSAWRAFSFPESTRCTSPFLKD